MNQYSLPLVTLNKHKKKYKYFLCITTLAIEFGDRYSQALTYHCLGTLAEEEENYAETRANLQKALEIYVEYKDEY
ncbi:hypothetical protein BZZ01_18310 [Nostocales cyanobacterium HT-58-2]|nr:hypothetical protein BZZ01_18310 [Nostocales cyanobacterium HT-58-2]